jgi:RNA polymerase sigma-70 factor (ECF subfamily)
MCKASRKISSFYEENIGRLNMIAFNLTRNRAMAEDAIQDALKSVWEDKESIIRMCDIELLKWCVKLVKNRGIDLLRGEGRRAGVPIDELQDILPSGSVPVEDYVARQEDYGILKKCVAKLDVKSSQVLEMKYVHGMSVKEIEMELGLTTAQVNGRLARARSKVKGLMEKEAVGYA